MRDNFDDCLSEVLRHEGGYVNHPRDPGGETNFGISRRSYPREDIKGMTRARASAIYRRDFWDAVRGDDLPAGLDLVAFDAAVNSGPARGIKWLQAGLRVDQDGKIGPQTLAAARTAAVTDAIDRSCDARLAFLKRLATWPTFGRGWTSRVASIRATAHRMASPARHVGAPPSAPVTPTPRPALPGWLAWLNRLFGGKP